MRRSLLPLLVLSAGLTIASAACSSDSSSSTTTAATTTTQAATTTVASSNPGPVGSASSTLCQAREDLRTSITDLSNVNVVANGTSAISDQLATIREHLAAVRSAAGDDVKAQADAFQGSLDALQTALGGSGASMVTGVVSAIRDVGTTGATLLTSLGNLSC